MKHVLSVWWHRLFHRIPASVVTVPPMHQVVIHRITRQALGVSD